MINPFIQRPITEHAPAYAKMYFDLTEDADDLLQSLEVNKNFIHDFILHLPEDKANYAYAEGKWTIKEIIGHMIDVERIFQDRVHRMGRMDKTDIPGFDHDMYVVSFDLSARSYEGLAKEFMTVRQSTIELFRNFQAPHLDFVGTANGNPLTARSAGWIMIGHTLHHAKVIREKYLID